MSGEDWDPFRGIVVPEGASGLRLDRLLSRWFPSQSRTWIARGIRRGEVRDAQERPLRASQRVRGGQALRLYLPGIAPSGPPPPFPEVLHVDDRVVAVHKPAGMVTHATGGRFRWGLVALARRRWPEEEPDLVHRLDIGTSGVILLTRDREANVMLKERLRAGACHKEYLAIVQGHVPWDEAVLEGPIGKADGVIRVQMAVRPDGLSARTDVKVLGRRGALSLVRCVLHTGRTHQIRVHLHHAGFPLLGDRLYGPPPQVFLDVLEEGVTERVVIAAGAPRQALHSHRMSVEHPDGGVLDITCPLPTDLQRWWDCPEVLPLDLS